MKIKQFEDKALSHFSYAVISGDKMAVIDPARNPIPYYQYAEDNEVRIAAIFETHCHADFVSSHLQIQKETGAKIYISKTAQADYEHVTFDEGDSFEMNDVIFSCLNTPGHAPESITVVASGKNHKTALFTGDTLFFGDVGRPDLQESSAKASNKREELAKTMYYTMQSKFNELPDDALVFPTHGSGSLCGKNLGDELISTLGRERKSNWAFNTDSEEDFVNEILKGQPFAPAYFTYNANLNRKGLPILETNGLLRLNVSSVEEGLLVIDTRDETVFKENHLPNSINIMAQNESDSFETWLGTLVKPEETFVVVISSVNDKDTIYNRIAKIGYESQIKEMVTIGGEKLLEMEKLCFDYFDKNKDQFNIIDIRKPDEHNNELIFENSLNFPLNELRDSYSSIPTDKPLVVHCGSGYRSAAGSSLLDFLLPQTTVYDLSDDILKYH